MCLGSPADLQQPRADTGTATYFNNPNTVDQVFLYDLKGFYDDNEDEDSDEEQWHAENDIDPYSPEDLRREAEHGGDRGYVAELYWVKRKAERKYAAARDRFGPRKRFAPRALAKRFMRRGPSKGRAPQRGFFINEHFVSLEHVPENELSAFFQGRPGGGK